MAIQTSEIRRAYLLNKYVIITPGRAKRPRDINEQTIIKRNDNCPFCVENVDEKIIVDKIINKKGKWEAASLKNIFPAVTLDNKKAYGTQEVIIETRDHVKELAELNERDIEKVLKMYAKRTKDISQIKDIRYILCFKNQGSKAGASIIHAHSQIFATNILPPDIEEEARLVKDYAIKNNSCFYCDIIKKEMKTKRRIFEDDNVAVFAPYASEYHYEAWFFTKRHVDNISYLKNNEIRSLANAFKFVLQKTHALDLSYNYFMHQVISDKDQHFYIKLQPRDSIWAGIELGSGVIINSVPPEEAAKYYRSILR